MRGRPRHFLGVSDVPGKGSESHATSLITCITLKRVAKISHTPKASAVVMILSTKATHLLNSFSKLTPNQEANHATIPASTARNLAPPATLGCFGSLCPPEPGPPVDDSCDQQYSLHPSRTAQRTSSADAYSGEHPHGLYPILVGRCPLETRGGLAPRTPSRGPLALALPVYGGAVMFVTHASTCPMPFGASYFVQAQRVSLGLCLWGACGT